MISVLTMLQNGKFLYMPTVGSFARKKSCGRNLTVCNAHMYTSFSHFILKVKERSLDDVRAHMSDLGQRLDRMRQSMRDRLKQIADKTSSIAGRSLYHIPIGTKHDFYGPYQVKLWFQFHVPNHSYAYHPGYRCVVAQYQ